MLWLLFGGLLMAIGWFLAGVFCMVTVVGIPLGIRCVKIAGLVLWPFGKEVIYGGQFLQQLGNIPWLLTAGWVLASAAGSGFTAHPILMPFGAKVG